MPVLSRRALGAALFAAPLAAGLPLALSARTRGGLVTPPAVAVRRVGRFTVAALSDGFLDAPFGWFTGDSPEAIAALAGARFAPGDGALRIGFTVWLIDDGERLILVDAGTAGAAGPTTGRLLAALSAVGVAPADIDAVIVTHMHFDHIAGLVAGNARVFPNATVHVDAREIAHFTDPARAAAGGDLLATSFAAAAATARLYPDLVRVTPGREIVRGVSVVDLAGHTPGHIGVRIEDGAEALTLVGDMLFDPAFHPGRTDVGIAFEADPAAALAMRDRFFPAAAERADLVAATHMPFPGIGRIVRDGARLVWLPVDWAYAA